ncbi:small, acid-soluble spore protein, alpha/beta type [Clostridium neuense]|uniref:Small, acid-soluble spore protein, alpha/beta type n=1 Tax=Clostridium neuense TaxID=1728934 RepID=A0ABW8T938_9CLOT
MAHKGNKNSKDNKKAGQKTKSTLEKMTQELSNEIGLTYDRSKRKRNKNSNTNSDPRS